MYLLTSRLQTLEASKSKVLLQIKELEAHREKLKATNGRDTDIPGRLCSFPQFNSSRSMESYYVPSGSFTQSSAFIWKITTSGFFPFYSELFEINNYVFRAVVEQQRSSHNLSFFLELYDDCGENASVDVEFEVSTFGPEKKTHFGQQVKKGTFRKGTSKIGVLDIFTAAKLDQVHHIIVQVLISWPSPSTPPLKDLWGDISTTDVMILTGEEEVPIYVHKAIVLKAIPKVMDVVVMESPPYARTSIQSLEPIDSSDIESLHSELSDGSSLMPHNAIGPNSESGTPPSTPSSPQSHKGNRKTKRASKSKSDRPTDLHDLQSTTPASPPAIREGEFSPVQGREVWRWPKGIPAISCYEVMRWIYLHEVPAVTKLHECESRLQLFHHLGAYRLFMAYLLKQTDAIRAHSEPSELIGTADFTRGFTKQFLRPVLLSALIEKGFGPGTQNWLARSLQEIDPSQMMKDTLLRLIGPRY
ncbi:hypothetical protein BGZ51_005606 [Haplosporangium sp. Z 767]|nr:hypothetical protein BGZ51_005606 [Haplosporangium sp. Z 767]